jgi:hypothetical protein
VGDTRWRGGSDVRCSGKTERIPISNLVTFIQTDYISLPKDTPFSFSTAKSLDIRLRLGVRLDDQRIWVGYRGDQKPFSLPRCLDGLWGPPRNPMGAWGGGKEIAGSEGDHSPPSSSEVKNV